MNPIWERDPEVTEVPLSSPAGIALSLAGLGAILCGVSAIPGAHGRGLQPVKELDRMLSIQSDLINRLLPLDDE